MARGERIDGGREMNARTILVWASHGVVAAALATAGALKALDPAAFAGDIGHYRIVSPFVAGVVAVYLPWLEIALAAGLLTPRARASARWLAAALLVGFCAALVSTITRGIDVRCGCFGAAAATGAGWALARNAVLLACLGVGAWAERRIGDRT